MYPQFTRQELAFLSPANRTNAAQEAEAIRIAAARASDEAIGRFIGRVARGVWTGLKALAALPRRQAVFAELSRLSDRELADIGINRGDIRNVFSEDFVSQAETLRQGAIAAVVPANSNTETTASRLAAAA